VDQFSSPTSNGDFQIDFLTTNLCIMNYLIKLFKRYILGDDGGGI